MKVKFTIEKMYEVNLPESIAEDYPTTLDYISAHAYDLIDNGKAKEVSESLTDVFSVFS